MSEQAVESLELFAEKAGGFLSDSLSERSDIDGSNGAGIYVDKPVAFEWMKILNSQVWVLPNWPVEYGASNEIQKNIIAKQLIGL